MEPFYPVSTSLACCSDGRNAPATRQQTMRCIRGQHNVCRHQAWHAIARSLVPAIALSLVPVHAHGNAPLCAAAMRMVCCSADAGAARDAPSAKPRPPACPLRTLTTPSPRACAAPWTRMPRVFVLYCCSCKPSASAGTLSPTASTCRGRSCRHQRSPVPDAVLFQRSPVPDPSQQCMHTHAPGTAGSGSMSLYSAWGG